MLQPILAIILGFVALIWSADRFIAGAASIANQLGMSKLLIGLTIVAFGTSAPEILVSLFAALEDSANLAVGNALGSNIANVGLVLGVTALMAAIPVKSSLIKSELPILMGVTIIAGYTLYDLRISLIDSLILLACLACFIFYLLNHQKNSEKTHDSLADQEEDEVEHFIGLSTSKAWLNLVFGLAILLISANVLVWGAKSVASALGVSELIIGLTVVAIGTSLPELAASVASALRGHHEIAFGNIIGSNIFNLVVVMAMPGLVGAPALDAEVFSRDYVAMVLISSLWVIMMGLAVLRKKSFSRFSGGLLLLSYGLYFVVLYNQI